MKRDATVGWLAEFQAAFGEALRTPLDRSQLKLRATPERYSDALVARLTDGPHSTARERMAVYNRQYWFRLLGVLQHEYLLTARLLGMWHFNAYAARFLEVTPPRHYDVQTAADGFAAFFERALEQEAHPQCGPLSEAVRIDSAYRDILRAREARPLILAPEQAARLPRARLVAQDSWRLAMESRAFVALRKELAQDATGESAVPLPEAHAEPRHWLLHALPTGLRAEPVHPLHAALLRALCEHTVQDALAHVEGQAGPEGRALLLQHAQGWLADSVHKAFWSGVSFPEDAR